MKEKFIILIVSDDKKGLLNQITAIFNRRNFDIESLNIARTDVSNIILLTIEVLLPVLELNTTLRKIEKIIEVYKVLSFSDKEAMLRKVSFFRVSTDILSDSILSAFTRYNVNITRIVENSLILEKWGSDEEISELYTILNGEYLLSFCKSSLVLDKGLINFQELCTSSDENTPDIRKSF